MEQFFQFIQLNFPFLIEHRYLFLFLGVVIEGFNVLILIGFLISTNSLQLWPSFLLFLVADIINGYCWYIVGYFAGSKPIDKWGRGKPKSRKIIETVQQYFEKYSGRALVITKFTFSLTIATLITAGSFKYDLKKFSLYNGIGSVLWVALTIFTGYFFGESYKFFFAYLKNLTYFLLFLGGAIAIIYLIKHIFGSVFIKSILIRNKLKQVGDKLREELDKFLVDEHGDK